MITLRHITVRRTPLDEWSARSRDLCLTTHNTHKKQTSMPPVGFGPTILASERPQTYALDRTATGISLESTVTCNIGDVVSVSTPIHYLDFAPEGPSTGAAFDFTSTVVRSFSSSVYCVFAHWRFIQYTVRRFVLPQPVEWRLFYM